MKKPISRFVLFTSALAIAAALIAPSVSAQNDASSDKSKNSPVIAENDKDGQPGLRDEQPSQSGKHGKKKKGGKKKKDGKK